MSGNFDAQRYRFFQRKMLKCETLKCHDVSKSFLNLCLFFVLIHQLGSRINFCFICIYTFCIFREIFFFSKCLIFFAKYSHFFAKQIEAKKAKIFAFFASNEMQKWSKMSARKRIKEKSMCSSESQKVTRKLRLIKYAINFNWLNFKIICFQTFCNSKLIKNFNWFS